MIATSIDLVMLSVDSCIINMRKIYGIQPNCPLDRTEGPSRASLQQRLYLVYRDDISGPWPYQLASLRRGINAIRGESDLPSYSFTPNTNEWCVAQSIVSREIR